MKQNKQNKDCKIVQDLLPNYIENLTDEVTNEYIEEHIAKCPECARILKDMNGEIKLEDINQDGEIKYLKGIHKRVRRTIAIVSLLVIVIAACIVGYTYNQSKIQVNNYTFMKGSYVRNNERDSKDGKIYGTLIAVLNEKGKCISARVVEEGYNETYLKSIEKDEITDSFTNFKQHNDSLHYNVNTWNGYTLEQIKEYWINEYKVKNLEEI